MAVGPILRTGRPARHRTHAFSLAGEKVADTEEAAQPTGVRRVLGLGLNSRRAKRWAVLCVLFLIADVAIAAISVAELRVGVLLADARRRGGRAAYVDDLVASLPILPYDLVTAEAHAELLAAIRRQGRPRGAHDLVIAATALSTGRTVVTADATAFVDLPGVSVRAH